jgi:hypothetical protein
MVAKDCAGVSDGHSAALIATGSVTATVSGAFMTVTALEPNKTLRPIWENVWFDIGFVCVIIGLILTGLGLYLSFCSQQSVPRAAKAAKSGPGAECGRLGSPLPSLMVKILADSRFECWRHSTLIASLHVEIENKTGNDIFIDGYEFMCDDDSRPLWDYRTTNGEWISVLQEIKRRDECQEHGQPLQDFTRIAACNRITGWFLVAISRNRRGGTPGCTIAVRDVLGNRYLAKLPGQDPQTYHPVNG